MQDALDIENKAFGFAKDQHDATGILYNGKPYFEGHVILVRQVLTDFGYNNGIWGARAYLHDCLEDCPVTREQLRKMFGIEIELPVFCVSGFGETRKIRNADQYRKIKAYCEIIEDMAAAIIKCADRIVNIEQSSNDNYKNMYRKEMGSFSEVVKPYVPENMWNRLENAFG